MTVSVLQLRVNSLEPGSSKNHKAILTMDRKNEGLDWKVGSIEATVEGLSRKFDGFMMFAKLSQFSSLGNRLIQSFQDLDQLVGHLVP